MNPYEPSRTDPPRMDPKNTAQRQTARKLELRWLFAVVSSGCVFGAVVLAPHFRSPGDSHGRSIAAGLCGLFAIACFFVVKSVALKAGLWPSNDSSVEVSIEVELSPDD